MTQTTDTMAKTTRAVNGQRKNQTIVARRKKSSRIALQPAIRFANGDAPTTQIIDSEATTFERVSGSIAMMKQRERSVVV